MQAYWLTVFSPETWRDFLAHSLTFAAFPARRAVTANKIAPDDRLICYATQVFRFVGMLEVSAPSYLEHSPDDVLAQFPLRVPVSRLVALPLEFGIPLAELFEDLTIFRRANRISGWRAYLRTSPLKWSTEDGDLLFKSLVAASEQPRERAIIKGSRAVPRHRILAMHKKRGD